MTKSDTAYAKRVRTHLESQFQAGPPHTVYMVHATWLASIRADCPPPKGMSNAKVEATVAHAVLEFFASLGFSEVGTILVNAKQRDEAAAREAAEKHAKAEAEVAPALALMKRAVTEVLVEAKVLSMKPVVNTPLEKVNKAIMRGH